MRAFEPAALWNKSKVFIDRALRARDEGDEAEFHLWAAISLEVLGKAALANVHPCLVADPQHFHSLLAAAGGPIAQVNVKSIPAKTVFERLTTVVTDFDKAMENTAMLMANRRNAELHSGETPTAGLDPRSWVPQFWRMTRVLITAQSRQLSDWLGQEEAERIEQVIQDVAELRRQTVLARIDRRRLDYAEHTPPGTPDYTLAKARAEARPLPPRLLASADAFEDHVCPACGLKAWLLGSLREEHILEVEHEADPEWAPLYQEWIELIYDVEEFRCPECGLALEGRDEIHYAGLPATFTREDEREPDYEPEYGND